MQIEPPSPPSEDETAGAEARSQDPAEVSRQAPKRGSGFEAIALRARSGRATLSRRFRRGGFARNVALLVGGTALAQVVSALVAPVLTRLYTPADFGIAALYASIAGLAWAVGTLRYELAITLPKDEPSAANVLCLAEVVVVIVAIVLGGAVWWLRDRIGAWTHTPELTPFLWLMPITLLWGGTYKTLSYWAVRRRDFDRLARTKVSQGLGYALTSLALGFLRVRPLGLIVGGVVGQSAGCGTLVALVLKHDMEAIKSIRFSRMMTQAWRYRRFPLFSVTSELNAAAAYLPSLMIASAFGAGVVGSFALVTRVMRLPLSFVGTAIGQVYTGEVAHLIRENPKALYSLLIRTTKRLAVLGIVVVVIGAAAPLYFPVVFGAQWREAGYFCLVMTPMMYAQFVVSPISSVANLLERQDIQLYGDGARAALIVAVFWLARHQQWQAMPAMLAFSIGMTVTYIGFMLVYMRVARSAAQRAA